MTKQLPRNPGRHLRLGIYGGTFDPVHLGHLILAMDAREQLKLDAVMFLPCGQSPHKTGRPPTAAKDRLALLRAALRGNPRCWLSRAETDRPGPSYAIDTAREIKVSFPHATLYWLIGADQLPKLSSWKDYNKLRRLVTFAVLERGTATRRAPSGVIRLPQPRRVDISASEIRERVKKKLPIDQLVAPAVASLIRRKRLYL